MIHSTDSENNPVCHFFTQAQSYGTSALWYHLLSSAQKGDKRGAEIELLDSYLNPLVLPIIVLDEFYKKYSTQAIFGNSKQMRDNWKRLLPSAELLPEGRRLVKWAHQLSHQYPDLLEVSLKKIVNPDVSIPESTDYEKAYTELNSFLNAVDAFECVYLEFALFVARTLSMPSQMPSEFVVDFQRLLRLNKISPSEINISPYDSSSSYDDLTLRPDFPLMHRISNEYCQALANTSTLACWHSETSSQLAYRMLESPAFFKKLADADLQLLLKLFARVPNLGHFIYANSHLYDNVRPEVWLGLLREKKVSSLFILNNTSILKTLPSSMVYHLLSDNWAQFFDLTREKNTKKIIFDALDLLDIHEIRRLYVLTENDISQHFLNKNAIFIICLYLLEVKMPEVISTLQTSSEDPYPSGLDLLLDLLLDIRVTYKFNAGMTIQLDTAIRSIIPRVMAHFNFSAHRQSRRQSNVPRYSNKLAIAIRITFVAAAIIGLTFLICPAALVITLPIVGNVLLSHLIAGSVGGLALPPVISLLYNHLKVENRVVSKNNLANSNAHRIFSNGSNDTDNAYVSNRV